MVLAAGMMVNANVRLLEPLGGGGMGSVWIAEHLGLDSRVAVKFLRIEGSADPTFRERFKREAAIAAKLRSVHVVQTLDHGMMDGNRPYIVMELLEGTDLTHAVMVRGALPLQQVSLIVSQVAKVLERAHTLGIIHRDIKPDNIFLADSDYELFVKVLDFGVAKLTDSGKAGAMTKTGAVVGTPEFMSPEQAIASKTIDHRSDLYTLALVAHYALTCELPFDPNAEQPLWVQMTTGVEFKLAQRFAQLPAGIDGWFAKALAPKPEARFQSARTMAEQLQAIVEEQAAETSAVVPRAMASAAASSAAGVAAPSLRASMDSLPPYEASQAGPPSVRDDPTDAQATRRMARPSWIDGDTDRSQQIPAAPQPHPSIPQPSPAGPLHTPQPSPKAPTSTMTIAVICLIAAALAVVLAAAWRWRELIF